MLGHVALGRLLALQVAGMVDAGADVKLIHAKASMAKLFVSEAAGRCADRAVQIFGGRGYLRSNVAERFLRELRVAGVVGRFHPEGETGPYVGQCLSACVYAMMGAVRRVAPPGSEVALHRMSIVETEGQGWFGQRTTRSFADPPMVAVLGRYARRMGIDPALVRTAESLPPDTVHVLSREEMRRWSLATSQF